MSANRTRPRRRASSTTMRRSQIVIAITLVLSLFVAWTMLAYSGAFDSVLRQKGKRGQGFSTASFNSNSPSKEYIYAGGRLVATEEPVAVNLEAPTNLIATPISNGQIQLTWSASLGAHHYRIERSTNVDTGFSPINTNWTASPFTDLVTFYPTAPATTYLYRVRAADASDTNFSQFSNIDYATNIIFTDSSLQGSTVQAQHLTELRVAVNAMRATKTGLAQASWTDPTLTPRQTPLRGQHIDELRTNLNEALNALSSQVPAAQVWLAQPYASSSPLAQKTIYAVDFQEIRDRVK